MGRKTRRRKKQSTGILSWFRSQQNITKVVYFFVAIIFVGGAFTAFGGSLGGGSCSRGAGGRPLTAEDRAWLAEAVAMVGDRKITRELFEVEWRQESQRMNRPEEEGVYVPPPEDSYIHRFQVLDGLMVKSLIEQESASKGISVTADEIEEQVTMVKDNMLGLSQPVKEKRSLFQRISEGLGKAKESKNYRARLWERLQLTPEQLEERIKMRLLEQKYFQNLSEETKTELDTEAKAKADEAVDKLNAGEDFAAIVEEYSDDAASKDKGGLVEDVKRDSDQPQEIIDNAFAMAVGEISPPFRVREEIQYPFGDQPQTFVFESFVILEVTDKRVAAGDEFESRKERLREDLRQRKWEAEKQNNPDALYEDIDVTDEELAADYEMVSFRMIKIDSYNMGLARARLEQKLEDLRETYEMTMLDPGINAWAKMRDGEYETAREEWALFITETESPMDDPDFLKLEEYEQESTLSAFDERMAVLNYINGLLYRIQIEGYRSELYQFYIAGEKQEKINERWQQRQENPPPEGQEDDFDLREPTEEEKQHYRALNEEALPYFDQALEVIREDACMFLHRGETRADLEDYEGAFEDFKEAAAFASDDLQLNAKLEGDVSNLLGMFDDAELAEELRQLRTTLGEKVDRLNAEREARMAELEGQGAMPQMGG